MRLTPRLPRAARNRLGAPRVRTMSTPVRPEDVPLAPPTQEEDCWKYPRPPAIQRTTNHLQVIWFGNDGTETVLAETKDAYRILETTHPPTYYLPPSAVKVALQTTSKRTMCEWKGAATYHTLTAPSGKPIANRIWSYERPVPLYAPLKDHVSFYASSGQSPSSAGGEWRCFVDGEQVGVQEGDFYGGWITKNITGKIKGGPGTWGW